MGNQESNTTDAERPAIAASPHFELIVPVGGRTIAVPDSEVEPDAAVGHRDASQTTIGATDVENRHRFIQSLQEWGILDDK